MAELNGIPVFKITFDQKDKKGIDFVSMVDYPAIQSNWVTLNNIKAPLKFTLVEEKQVITGPILIPDFPIYRVDPVTKQEYYVVFSKEVIEGLVRKFQAQQKTINLNYQHQDNSAVQNAVIQEIWISGKIDKSQSLGFSHPEGSAFISAHIGDKKFWDEEVKTGKVKGFSIEGFLDMELKKQVKTTGQKFDSIKRAENNDLFISGPLEVGNYVYYGQPQIVLIGNKKEEMRNPIWESLVELADGKAIFLDNGKIVQIVEKGQPRKLNKNQMKLITASTDKGVEINSPGESFVVGADVTTKDESGKDIPVPDGSHKLENGSTLVVVGGKVTEIIEADPEDLSTEEMAAMNKLFASVLKPFQDEITALKAKIDKIPAGKPATGAGTDPEPATKTALQKVLALREHIKNNSKK